MTETRWRKRLFALMCSHVKVPPLPLHRRTILLPHKVLSDVWPLSTRLSVALSRLSFFPPLQVNEHLKDILVEEQKLRETFQDSNTTTPKVRQSTRKHPSSNNLAAFFFFFFNYGLSLARIKIRKPLAWFWLTCIFTNNHLKMTETPLFFLTNHSQQNSSIWLFGG